MPAAGHRSDGLHQHRAGNGPHLGRKDFLTVTPGIRFAEDAKGDQKRVTTPSMARKLGSTYIVVGRSITGAADPVAAYRRAMQEFTEGEYA
ncbi:hypothetical protein FYJ51_03525 [Erysipelotrichaceae bacterium Oil+RF-744-GAM-WT-6]|uniref:Orotidine 5'-phosphate decarboxylase n=1 Tax=Stecheria intestinalis TaxID=2606630 RepID=A0A7X2NRX5_9FIRM|nr:hypothetical protein [Stecheria intestinalis]